MIQEIKEVPVINPTTSKKQMIRDDIRYALNNHIEKFEFQGDYNWKYLSQYAREVASRLFANEIFYPIKNEVEKELNGKYERERVFAPPYCRYTKEFITIQSRRLDDRIHVYATINFDYIENLKEILMRDTKKKYEKG